MQEVEQCRSNCRRLQGKDCSYNPFAFPPSLEVRCRRYDPMASIVPTMLLHFLRPWRSDGGGRPKQEARAESEAGARAESNAGAVADDCRARIVPTILLHFLRPWRSDAGGTTPRTEEVERSRSQSREQCRSNCRRLQGKDCSYNPFAFPPSLEVRCRRYDSTDGGGRAKQEPEPRAMQEQLPTTAGMQEVEQCRSNCRAQGWCKMRTRHSPLGIARTPSNNHGRCAWIRTTRRRRAQ